MKINSTKLLTLKKWIFFLIFCVSELCVSFFIGIYSSLVLEVIHISVFSTLLILYMIKSSHSLKYYGIHLQYPISQIYCSITTFLVLLLILSNCRFRFMAVSWATSSPSSVCLLFFSDNINSNLHWICLALLFLIFTERTNNRNFFTYFYFHIMWCFIFSNEFFY